MALKHNEGYPMTLQQFTEHNGACSRLRILDENITAFKKACYDSIVPYIEVCKCLKEEKPEHSTFFFVKYNLAEQLFTLGRHFEIERQKTH